MHIFFACAVDFDGSPSSAVGSPRLAFFSSTLKRARSVLHRCATLTPFAIIAISPPQGIWAAEPGALLKLSEAVQLASQDQPQLDALRMQRQAALGAARAESELPDPKLALGIQNLPATGSEAFRLDRDDMTMVSIGIMQDVVTRAKRTAASARMTAEAARLEAEQELSARGIRRETAFAWLDVFEAQRRAATLRSLVVELTAERQVSEGGLSSGSMSAGDILGIDAELSRLRDGLIVAERDEARSRAMLSRWIGEHSMRPLPESLPHDLRAGVETDNASADVLGSHPSLESTQRAIDVAMHEVDRARAERRPDWSWQLMYGQRQDDRTDMVSLQVTVGLPLNRADRQDQRVAQKLAMAGAARNEMFDRRRLLTSELAIVRVDLDASVAQLREHAERRLPAARARVATAEAAYAGGGQSLLEVWRARRDLIEVELHHDMILAGRARALAQLAWLIGETEVTP